MTISGSYFLSVAAPIIIDSEGKRWCGELWAKDLALHLDYIDDLILGSPCEYREPTQFESSLDNPPFSRIKFIDLPSPKTHKEALFKLPQFVAGMWQGVRSCRIVHTGFGSWPISEGWLAVPMGRMMGRFVITNVESSFWRADFAASPLQRLRSKFVERINRFCVKAADLRFFTSRTYKEQFLGKQADRAFVVPATWIDSSDILSVELAGRCWDLKQGRVRLLFAGRLIADKGIAVLLDAMRTVAGQKEVSLEIAIVGSGEFWEACADLKREIEGASVRLDLLQPVSYGEPFFELLRGFDAVLVPSLSDEQPRLIYDAFSQSVPILGSNTGGIAQVVQDNRNGVLFEANDARELAATLKWASANRSILREMGLNALSDCLQFTHKAMHATREKILEQELSQR